MTNNDEVQITGITFGCQDILEGAHMCFINGCRRLMDLAIEVDVLAVADNLAAANPLMYEVHQNMIAMAKGDVSFQISNGQRILMFTGGDHCKTSFLYSFPGKSVDVWSVGQ